MSLNIQLTTPDGLPKEAIAELQGLPLDEVREVLIAGLYGKGMITSKTAQLYMGVSKREFYEMLTRNNVPISGYTTSEDIENNNSIYAD